MKFRNKPNAHGTGSDIHQISEQLHDRDSNNIYVLFLVFLIQRSSTILLYSHKGVAFSSHILRHMQDYFVIGCYVIIVLLGIYRGIESESEKICQSIVRDNYRIYPKTNRTFFTHFDVFEKWGAACNRVAAWIRSNLKHFMFAECSVKEKRIYTKLWYVKHHLIETPMNYPLKDCANQSEVDFIACTSLMATPVKRIY